MEGKHSDRNEAALFSGLESPMHLLVVLIVAVLVLGPKKLPEVGRSLGSGMRQFKASLEGGEREPTPPPDATEDKKPGT